MNPLTLNAQALLEPWRLWSGHLVHFGWAHAVANVVALTVPLLLACRRDRLRLILVTLLLAPLLSLVLLPALGGDEYRGASGLACALWALVGLRLTQRRESASTGLLMLGGLALKLGSEAAFSSAFLLRPEGWQTLPAAHLWGTALGLAFALLIGFTLQPRGRRIKGTGRG